MAAMKRTTGWRIWLLLGRDNLCRGVTSANETGNRSVVVPFYFPPTVWRDQNGFYQTLNCTHNICVKKTQFALHRSSVTDMACAQCSMPAILDARIGLRPRYVRDGFLIFFRLSRRYLNEQRLCWYSISMFNTFKSIISAHFNSF